MIYELKRLNKRKVLRDFLKLKRTSVNVSLTYIGIVILSCVIAHIYDVGLTVWVILVSMFAGSLILCRKYVFDVLAVFAAFIKDDMDVSETYITDKYQHSNGTYYLVFKFRNRYEVNKEMYDRSNPDIRYRIYTLPDNSYLAYDEKGYVLDE